MAGVWPGLVADRHCGLVVGAGGWHAWHAALLHLVLLARAAAGRLTASPPSILPHPATLLKVPLETYTHRSLEGSSAKTKRRGFVTSGLEFVVSQTGTDDDDDDVPDYSPALSLSLSWAFSPSEEKWEDFSTSV